MDYPSQRHGLLFCATLTIGLILVWKLFVPSLRRQPTYITKNRAECTQIIAGTIHNGTTNALTKFEARAKANTRLSRAFGIDNAFTTEDSKRHSNYIKYVSTLLRPNWKTVARDAKELATSSQYSQNLIPLVQTFVLKMTINLFYQQDFSKLDDKSMSFVAAEVNRIWIQSKVSCQAVQWTKQHKLHETLGRLIPGCNPLDPHTNPMNLILPAFETMWRVVLRCFIEVRFRGAKETNEWTAALKAYLEDPDPQQGHTYGEKVEIVQTSSIVREALRLYPPTRHIQRYYEFSNGYSLLAIADIEGLHRDTKIWSSDADCFRPSRWASISAESEQLKAWMPFGASPFLCPAKPDFGPRMIGILVAALVEAFCDVKYELGVEGPCGRTDMAEFHGSLHSERDSYEELFLWVNACCGC